MATRGPPIWSEGGSRHARWQCAKVARTTIDRIGRLKGPLTIHCGNCNHATTWSIEEARRKLGGGCIISDAKRVLRCSVCGGGDHPFV